MAPLSALAMLFIPATAALDTCRILPCTASANAECVSGACVCGDGTVESADGLRCEQDGKTSLGDRLVLENLWVTADINATQGGSYDTLPLTAADATAANWVVSDQCVEGRGREATNEAFANGVLHLWYDAAGLVIGYEPHTPTNTLNHNICQGGATGGSKCAVMFRKQATACSGEPRADDGGPGAKVASIGDRLLFPYWDGTGGELPLTLAAVKSHSPPFVDAESCLANMGHHFVTPLASTSPVIPMYYEKSGVIDGLLMTDPIPDHQPSPPFEKFAAFSNVMSLHVYFKDHMAACEK